VPESVELPVEFVLFHERGDYYYSLPTAVVAIEAATFCANVDKFLSNFESMTKDDYFDGCPTVSK
jgi:hypothetical protein